VIDATFDTRKNKELPPHIFHGKCQSNEVTIVINQPNTDSAKAEVLSVRARYFTVRQEYDEEIKLLNMV